MEDDIRDQLERIRASYVICHMAIFTMSPKWRFDSSTADRLETAVHQAMLATRIVAGPVLRPIGGGDQLGVGLVMGIAQAGSTARASRRRCAWDSPRRHSPTRRSPQRKSRYSGVATRRNRLSIGLAAQELGMHVVAGHEEPLGAGGIGRADGLIGIGRRDHETADAQFGEKGPQHADLVHVGLLVDRGVRGDLETGGHGRLDAGHRGGKAALALDHPVVRGLHAVEVHVEEQPRRGPEAGQLLLEHHGVGADVNVLLPLDQLGDQLFDPLVDQRFAAANADHRGAALVGRGQAVFHRHAARGSWRHIRESARSPCRSGCRRAAVRA